MFKGAMVALVTPFKNGKVDKGGLKKLVEFQIKNGTDGIIPCGTTGESATLSHKEHTEVIELVVEAADRRVPVIAGTGSNSTQEALKLTKHAKRAGADGALLITPYYNKPTQEGLYQHYRMIAEEVDIPIVLYNIPGRTGVNLLPQTVASLSQIKNIIAIKEATGDLKQVSEILHLCGDKMTVISGDDFTTLPTIAAGGKGVISVTSNIVPRDIADITQACLAGALDRARELNKRLWPLHQAMFLETSPIPVKTALFIMGMISAELRLPLSPMKKDNVEKLKKALKNYGLI